MYRYEGLVVHQSHDHEGIIEIVDKDGERALHFGSESRQSSMLLADPNRLNSLYARAMMAGLLFNQQPRNVLMIGLGGGTIAKFLLHQFAECRIKAVEYRSSVVKVARSHFGLPLEPRLKIKVGCGAQHVRAESQEHSELYDVILIDAYDHEGMAAEVSSEIFFDHCHQLLTAQGLLIINLWATDKDLFQQVSWYLSRVFAERVVFLPVRNRGNSIGFAFANGMQKYSMKTLTIIAKQLEQRYQLEFSSYLQDLKRHNASVINRVIKS